MGLQMSNVPLTEQTQKRLNCLFSGDDAILAADLLANECANNLPFCENDGPQELERLRFAALKVSEGGLDRLCAAVDLAKQDWRDLLVAADFSDDVEAHKKWMPQ